MKTIYKSAFLATAAAFAVSPIFGVANVSAATSYHDFSALNRNTLNGAYSHTKIYYRDNTKISVVRVAGNATEGASFTTTSATTDVINVSGIKEGQTLDVLIEDSTATDDNGKDVDVIYRVSNVEEWELDPYLVNYYAEHPESTPPEIGAGLSFNKTIYGSDEPEHPANIDDDAHKQDTVHAGDPIIAWNNTYFAKSTFTVKFCEKGSYSATSHDCTTANVSNISAALWDFDVPVPTDRYTGDYSSKSFNGNEGIIPSGNVNIYYNQNSPVDGVTLSTEGGFSVSAITNGATFNGIWYGNSIMATATGINGAWSYQYTGTSCGVSFLFGSAVPYDMPKPQKTVDKETAKIGDEVTYTIKQEVPFNYTSAADTVTFMSLWSKYDSIPENKGYASLKITDTFQKGLKMPKAEETVIKDEKGNPVTNLFDIVIDGQTFTATAKDATAMSLYGHTFTITIKTLVTDTVKISPFENTAETIYTPAGNNTNTNLPSNTVETSLVRKVITKHVDDKTGKEIATPTTKEYPQGGKYTTSKSNKVPKGYELVKTPANAKGTVADNDIVVIYRYRKVKNPVTLDNSTNAFIGVALASIVGGGLFFGIKRRR